MDNELSGAEELYETLIELENERIISSKINQENENLLKGLHILVDRFNKPDILFEVISVLRNIVGCQDVIILTVNEKNQLATQSATSIIFNDLKLKPQVFLNRIIQGGLSITFDMQSIPEWQLLYKKIDYRINSAIHAGLKYGDKQAVLICCDSQPNFFSRTHSDLIKRYLTLVTQALMNLETQDKINALNNELLNTAHLAGMSEVAVGILHNMGNALNSLSVSSDILRNKVNKFSIDKLDKLVNFMKNNPDKNNLNPSKNKTGNKLFKYLSLLAVELNDEKSSLLEEIHSIAYHIDQIRNVVHMQESTSKPINLISNVSIPELINGLLKTFKSQLLFKKIDVINNCKDQASIMIDKFQLEKIIDNLIQNAIDSLTLSTNTDKQIIITVVTDKNNHIIIKIADNGLGISPENINKIFGFGYTSKNKSRGFGLHHCAIYAKNIGGNLQVSSDGIGQGAVFTLTLGSRIRKGPGVILT